MKPSIRQSIIAAVALCAVASPRAASACAVCMGASDSPIASAINGAIFLMLGFVGLMMAGVLGFMFYLSRRANHPSPPHEELAQALAEMEEKQHA